MTREDFETDRGSPLEDAFRRVIESRAAFSLIVSDGLSERLYYFAIGGLRPTESGPPPAPSPARNPRASLHSCCSRSRHAIASVSCQMSSAEKWFSSRSPIQDEITARTAGIRNDSIKTGQFTGSRCGGFSADRGSGMEALLDLHTLEESESHQQNL